MSTQLENSNMAKISGSSMKHPHLTSPSLGEEPSRDGQSHGMSGETGDPASVPSLNRGGLGWGHNNANQPTPPTGNMADLSGSSMKHPLLPSPKRGEEPSRDGQSHDMSGETGDPASVPSLNRGGLGWGKNNANQPTMPNGNMPNISGSSMKHPHLPSPSLGEEPSRDAQSHGMSGGTGDPASAPSPIWGGLGWGKNNAKQDGGCVGVSRNGDVNGRVDVVRYGNRTYQFSITLMAAIFLALLTIFLAPGAAHAQGPCELNAGASLQSALNNGCTTINIGPGTFNTVVAINRNVTLRGAGAGQTTLKGNAPNLGRVLLITNNANVTVENLTITGGVAQGTGDNANGGGIFVASGKLTLNSVNVSGNKATYGGGIYIAEDAEVTITDSTISGNTTTNSGGGILNDGTATVSNSTITGNTATNSGGGILNSIGGTAMVSNSTISGNSAINNGGGIYNVRTATVSNSTISGNSVSNNGGGIYAILGTVNVRNSTLSGNSATSGGSIYRGNATVVVKHSILASTEGSDCNRTISSSGNNLSKDSSCGLNADGDIPDVDPRLGPLQDNGGPTLTHALLLGSPAIDAGATTATTTTDQRGFPRISNGPLASDNVDIGAVEMNFTCFVSADNGITLRISETNDVLPQAINDAAAGSTIKVAGTCKGATLNINKSITIEGGYSYGLDEQEWAQQDLANKTILDGDEQGPVVKLAGNDADITLDGLILQNGRGAEGGAIDNHTNSKVTILKSILRDNHAVAGGGGIYSIGPIIIEDSALNANKALGGRGGGVTVGTSLLLTNSTLRDNEAKTDGGGIFGGAFFGTDPIVVTNSTIINNKSITRNGGGIYTAKPITITNSTLADNVANSGGGIYKFAGTAAIRFTTFSGNGGTGANLYNREGDVKLFATILTAPAAGGLNCAGTAPTSENNGYNRSSDASCNLTGTDDQNSAEIQLELPALNKGTTLSLLPVRDANNSILDVVPTADCEAVLGGTPVDQRGLPRSLKAFADGNAFCDVGAVEIGLAFLYVCGALPADVAPAFCEGAQESIRDALNIAVTDDTIVVSGIVTETVVVTKSVTIRGPNAEEAIAGAHMGVVQASTTGNAVNGSVFTVGAGNTVTIANLNIRHGNAANGGGVNNSGDLTLSGVTIYKNKATTNGGGVYNQGAGTLTVRNSTLSQNVAATGVAVHNAGGATSLTHTTLAGSSLCAGTITSGGGNIATSDSCGANALFNPVSELGPLRDNGGATLTHALTADSRALSAIAACSVDADQRGKARTIGETCDAGAVQSGSQQLVLCEACDADGQTLFTDLQVALNSAMAGDTIAIRAGSYTGNFDIYKDVTLEHAGIDVNLLNREDSHDVRAILQASDLSIREQLALPNNSGSVLSIQGFTLGATAVEPSSEVAVTLRGLTIQQGLSNQGGGIYNLGALNIYTSTLADNAARDQAGAKGLGGAIYNAGEVLLDRATVSNNRAEYRGGAIYNAGTDASLAGVKVRASTLAHNRVGRIGEQSILVIDNGANNAGPQFIQSSTVITSGDELLFQNRLPFPITLNVGGTGCNVAQIEVPPVSVSSTALVCTAETNNQTITLNSTQYDQLEATVTVTALAGESPSGHIVYQTGNTTSYADFTHSILMGGGDTATNCARDENASFISQGYNLANDESCSLIGEGDLVPGNADYKDPQLQPLQDNNWIDFETHYLSGYTYMHALRPDSAAIDRIPAAACSTAEYASLDLATAQATIAVGDIVDWTHNVSSTIAFNDGEADVVLIDVPANGTSKARQFNQAGTFAYRIYNNQTMAATGQGTITVTPRTRSVDQRGLPLPQRGPKNLHHCDIGAYEFKPLVVGEPVLRPPAAVGSPSRAVSWLAIDGDSLEEQGYHAWSSATAQDFPLHPSRSNADQDLGDNELVVLRWTIDANLVNPQYMSQIAVVEWPDDPQLHVSGAGVSLSHTLASDGFILAGGVRAFEDINPEENIAGNLIVNGQFQRTTLSAVDGSDNGDSYTVLQFAKGAQDNVTSKVKVVKTVDWNTPGVRDVRQNADGTTCIIGSELDYSINNANGDLVYHSDPEGKAGQILWGDDYDGVETQAEQLVRQNTVAERIPPIHVRESRDGEIFPIMNQVITNTVQTTITIPMTSTYDLGVAWYRTNARNAAWPVKSVGYQCQWPQNPPEIVIASELGSEIGGQGILDEAGHKDLTVYHQTDETQPGYSPNHEHALLSDSNLGNVAPALYALRTDLLDRDSRTTESDSYALLKYRDPREEDLPKIGVYKVKLTRGAEPIATDQITLIASDINVPAQGDFTLPIEIAGVQNLRTITVTVPYAADKVTPTRCAVNGERFIEAAHQLSLVSDSPVIPKRVIRLRADLGAGTNISYHWDFGDGTTRIAGREVSHVYGVAGDYTVTVRATNGLFADVSQTVAVEAKDDALPVPLTANELSGCRIDTPGQLTFQLKARAKHGVSGSQVLADVTFAPVGGGVSVNIAPVAAAAMGPSYEEMAFDVTAGNPIFAPTPMRNLLDVQTCAQTVAFKPEDAKPFWRDFKDNIWARAAGSMQILYYYPLQPGFYMNNTDAVAAGIDTTALPTIDERVGQCVPWLQKEAGTLASTSTDPNRQVYPVTYNASWPDLAPLLTVGETVYERPKNGISGVAEQLAVNKVYDDMAPGQWDNNVNAITIEGTEVITNLAQLIDPVGEVRVTLPIKINDNNALPIELKSERLLFGGGVAIVGTADNEISLPFSLRSRILFDDINGELIFRGYYDGASPNYIKGDPLLLLNVMSKSDRKRLQDLCSTGTGNCNAFNKAIDQLYYLSRNPRKLDLCRENNGIGAVVGGGSPERMINEAGTEVAVTPTNHPLKALINNPQPQSCLGGGTRDGIPDADFLISVQDTNNDGLPEPYAGLGKGKALSAGNAAGTGYITLAYNNDDSLGSLPVSLQVLQVGCTQDARGNDSTYRGNVLVIDSDNLFDEKLTLRHTGDFGGMPDNFEFEWFIAGVDDTGVSPAAQPPSYPWSPWTRIEPGANAVGPEITIEGANPTTLADNWLLARYKGYAACGNQYRYSAYAGDPSAKPSEVRAQLAQGWIKRVVDALNPYDARVDDFANNSINTNVDMVRQAGSRYEGPIPFTNDPETLNGLGLIESYQTILDRGRILSIDSNINDQGANAALLNVTSRIADLYMLLANDAYADALDPTVGLGTGSAAGSKATALFSFMNQFRPDQFGPIDEELALLRGRDETLGGVAAAPTYNRLTWNFSNGEGQVAYQQNYNVQDINADGFINEADAAALYPQGHGDAWGHQLTAMQGYYNLLRHSTYTWSPRAEPVLVAGSPLVVDYYDERRFAIAAANKAKIGAEVVDLTYRKNYAEPSSQEYVDTHVDSSDDKLRAWGVADWAVRSGQGAYVDWVVANAILPPEETRFSDVRKVDRATVTELSEIAANYALIQEQLDQADNKLNPLGLVGNAVLFDLDPARIAEGKTHFEQVYERAITNLDQTVSFFDHANEMKQEQRDAEVDTLDFVHRIIDEDTARVNSLIELFGYPYSADIGVNGTYAEGYKGPDIYNYDLYDRNELTDSEKRCHPDDQPCSPETQTILINYSALDCLYEGGQFRFKKLADVTSPGQISGKDVCPITTGRDSEVVTVTHTIGIGLDAGRGRFKPAAWGSDAVRAAPGEIQNALQVLTQSRLNYEQAILEYEHHVTGIERLQKKIKDRASVLENKRKLTNANRATILTMDTAIFGMKIASRAVDEASDTVFKVADAAKDCPPHVLGLANDATSVVRCTISFGGTTMDTASKKIILGLDYASDTVDFAKKPVNFGFQTRLFDVNADYELYQLGLQFGGLERQEKELRLAVFLAKDEYIYEQGTYDYFVQQGFRELADLSRLRKRWAGQISSQRYNDMAFRIHQIDALQKYRSHFDLAQTYAYLTAAAYDYETNLSSNEPASGNQFLRQIVGTRNLGEIIREFRPDGTRVTAVTGAGGLADPMGQMRENFGVLKGQIGFNNPQDEANQFSLRHELFRLREESDADWQQTLQRYYVSDIWSNDSVSRLAKRPYDQTGAAPGLVIPFNSTISLGQNFFNNKLGKDDSSYSSSQFSTKIANLGVWLEGYDEAGLAQTPRVYLIPAGRDVLRPRGSEGEVSYWNVTEQLLPVPNEIGPADLANPSWIPRIDGLSGEMYQSKPFADMRAYPLTDDLTPESLNLDTRLIGRSVWNTEWILVIPGWTLLGDAEQGLEQFIEHVDDIHLYLETYSYAGTAAQ